jgi:hypothetical protein
MLRAGFVARAATDQTLLLSPPRTAEEKDSAMALLETSGRGQAS